MRVRRSHFQERHRQHFGLAILKSLLLVFLLIPTTTHSALAREHLKKDKFRGTVVHAGPKAITVKSQKNIYKVRTFNYTSQLEKKIHTQQPMAGKKVTVHYFRGTDVAAKVD